MPSTEGREAGQCPLPAHDFSKALQHCSLGLNFPLGFFFPGLLFWGGVFLFSSFPSLSFVAGQVSC